MCERGPKLAVVRHIFIPNHPTAFGRNFECEMIFASLRPFTVRLSITVRLSKVSIRASVIASKVLYVQQVKENRRTLTPAKYT